MTKIHYLFCAFFISVGVYAVGLNTTALLDMQSAMARYFHFGDVGARWLVNSYMLAVTSTILAAGKLCDFFNKKRVFLFGGTSFVIASVVLALSFHPLLMFIGRVWQGLSVSIAIPSSIAVLKAYIPEKWRIGAFGLWSALMGLGFATGPVLGGVVTQFWGWQFVFLISAVLALISVIASVFLIPIVKEQIVNRHFDWRGFCFFVLGMAIFIIGFMKGEVWGWNNIIILLCLVLGVYLLYIFFFLERHTARPLWAPSTFANTKLLASSIGNFGFCIGVVITLSYLLLFFQDPVLMNLSPWQAGLLLLPFSLVVFLISLAVPKLNQIFSRVSYLLAIGFTFLVAAYVWLYFYNNHFGYGFLITPIIFAGIGVGILQSNLPRLAAESVPETRLGEAVGINWTFYYFGIVLFITLFGIIYDHVWQVSFTHLATTIQCDDCSRQIINKLLHTRRFDTGAARMILKQVPQVRPIYQQSIVHAFNLVMLFSAFFMFVIGVLTLMLAAHGNKGSTNKKAADDSGL